MPINRSYALEWMTYLKWSSDTDKDIKDYIKFFNRLTQVIILKTLDIHAEEKLKIWCFSEQLDLFLKTGKIS